MEPTPPIPALVQTPSRAVSISFWFSWSINAVIAAIALYFFFWGLSDGTVSSFNMLLWLGLLGAVGLVVIGSLAPRANGQLMLGFLLNLLLALPGLMIGFFFLVLTLSHPSWH